jgi:thiamine pyrophosphate-dependent acetolactate synthase large subunit-like protein
MSDLGSTTVSIELEPKTLEADTPVLSTSHLAEDAPEPWPIVVPREMRAAGQAPTVCTAFPMTGAQVLARVCAEEQLGAMFCASGNYAVVNAVAEAGIPSFGGRRESAMAHAADGFTRVTGLIAMCSAAKGPGLVEMISGIASANAAKTPLLVVAAHASPNDDMPCQHQDQQALTAAFTKYQDLVSAPANVYESASSAFRHLKSGIPRPVHLDIPGEVADATFESEAELTGYCDRHRYRSDARPYPSPVHVRAAVELLRGAERPLIVSSNGVFYSRAWDALMAVAKRGEIPVVESGAMKGQCSDALAFCANASPKALANADVVMLAGQHCVPRPGQFGFHPDVRYIRIDPCAEDIGRNLPIHVGIVSCEKAGLEAIADAMPRMTHSAWLAEIADARNAFERENDAYYREALKCNDCIHPAVLAKEIADFLYRGPIPREATTVVSGGYGAARYTRRWLRGYRPGQVMNAAYHYGAVGPDIGYAVGVAAAVELGAGPQAAYRGSPILCITGDAGCGYTMMELETLAKYGLSAIIVIYNNNASGSWTKARHTARALPVHLYQENLRYDKIAEALGAHGEYVRRPHELRPALERAYTTAAIHRRPAVINCQGRKEFWTSPPGILPKVEPGCTAYYY